MKPRIVEIRQGVLDKNDNIAHGLRTRFQEAGVCVINLVSSPGTGKTELLEKTLAELAKRYNVAALVGDLATENDAKRLAQSGAPVRLSVTEGEDKPLKYPPMFHSADAAVITKIDLAEACEFDREAAYANIQNVCPGAPIIETSARSLAGMDEWVGFLEKICHR